MKSDIEYWLSRQFRKSECYQFLEHIIENNQNMYNCIEWTTENYYRKIGECYVKYNFFPETDDISIRIGNNDRKVDITISNDGNSVDIKDQRKNQANDATKIDIHHIIHNTNKTSYYNHKNLTKYNNGNIIYNYDRKLHIDDYTKKVLNHYDSDVDKTERSNRIVHKQKRLTKKPRRVRVWHHI